MARENLGIERRATRVTRGLVAAVLTVAFVSPALRDVRAQNASPRTAGDFRVAWYDYITGPANLPSMRGEGMNTVVPYHAAGADVLAYLDAAREAGVQVFLEVDRAIVRAGDEAAMRSFVAQYKSHPALEAWYLADEPSINTDLGPLSVETAERLYAAIKAEDPVHPVAIAFSSTPSDDVNLYWNAYDIAMWDEYPAKLSQPEFSNLEGWRKRLNQRAWQTQTKQAWIPVIQAFTTGTSGPQRYYRLPTSNEARYMTYTAVQSGATGIFWWARYRSTWTYLQNVVKPLTAEVIRLGPALKAGAVIGAVSVHENTPSAVVRTYRDPTSGRYTTIVINHSAVPVEATLLFEPTLNFTIAQLAGGDGAVTPIDGGTMAVPLRPYEVRVYDLS